jgi:two-component system phosphate regulon response regulator PhoB
MPKDSVLIVDDARTTRTHLQLMLSAQYDCSVADSAESGLDLARAMNPRPRAILLDVQMPGIGGIEALKRLKADETLRDIPVIMVTTRGEEETLAVCQAAGCDGYVTKPVQTGELFTVLRNLLRGAR